MSAHSKCQDFQLSSDDINFSQKRLQAGRHGHGPLVLQYQPSVDDSGCDLCGDNNSDLAHYLLPRYATD